MAGISSPESFYETDLFFHIGCFHPLSCFLFPHSFSSGAPPAGAGGSFPKHDIPRLAESIQPPAGAGGFRQRGKETVFSSILEEYFIEESRI